MFRPGKNATVPRVVSYLGRRLRRKRPFLEGPMRLTAATTKSIQQSTAKLVLWLVALGGCASKPTPPAEYPPLEATAATAATEPQPAAEPTPPPEPPAPPVQVV